MSLSRDIPTQVWARSADKLTNKQVGQINGQRGGGGGGGGHII